MTIAHYVAIVLTVVLIGVFVHMYSSYKDMSKKLIDLEYKKEKQDVKDAVKNDSIDTVYERIKRRFGW